MICPRLPGVAATVYYHYSLSDIGLSVNTEAATARDEIRRFQRDAEIAVGMAVRGVAIAFEVWPEDDSPGLMGPYPPPAIRYAEADGEGGRLAAALRIIDGVKATHVARASRRS